MNEPTWVTVTAAEALTGRGKSTIYRLIERDGVPTQDSTAGMLVHLPRLRQVIANKKRGRPRHGQQVKRPSQVVVEHEPIVYYLRFGSRCKIGTTTQILTRMRMVLCDELIAYEPGGRRLERQRHVQFSDTLVAGQHEWFEWSPELASHTLALAVQRDPQSFLDSLHAAA